MFQCPVLHKLHKIRPWGCGFGWKKKQYSNHVTNGLSSVNSIISIIPTNRIYYDLLPSPSIRFGAVVGMTNNIAFLSGDKLTKCVQPADIFQSNQYSLQCYNILHLELLGPRRTFAASIAFFHLSLSKVTDFDTPCAHSFISSTSTTGPTLSRAKPLVLCYWFFLPELPSKSRLTSTHPLLTWYVYLRAGQWIQCIWIFYFFFVIFYKQINSIKMFFAFRVN